MRNYNKMAAVGVLVGSEPTAHIKGALLLPGIPDIVYTPTEADMEKLLAWLGSEESEVLTGVLGPAPSRGAGAAGRQQQCLVKVPVPGIPVFLAALRRFLIEKGGRFWIDVDPLSVF